MMTCKELVERVTEYLEGALPEDTRQAVEEHIKGCTGCRRYLEQMRKTILIAGKLTEDDISEDAKVELLSVFRDWKNARSEQ